MEGNLSSCVRYCVCVDIMPKKQFHFGKFSRLCCESAGEWTQRKKEPEQKTTIAKIDYNNEQQ